MYLGRLKSDYQYILSSSTTISPGRSSPRIGRNRPLRLRPRLSSEARAQYPESSLADLYDPLTMPPELVQAHRKLDAAVDAAYARRKFSGDRDRLAFLFELYQQIVSPLVAQKNLRRRAKPKTRKPNSVNGGMRCAFPPYGVRGDGASAAKRRLKPAATVIY